MATYNGHKNWNHWNVALWLSNDETLYALARRAIKDSDSMDQAARALLEELHARECRETPDGAPYSFTTIRAALKGGF